MQHGVPRHVLDDDYEGDEGIEDHLDRNVNDGESKYKFLQGLDDAYQFDHNDTDELFPNRVGYTAPYEAMRKIDPNQVHIFNVHAHHGATPEVVPEEQEM